MVRHSSAILTEHLRERAQGEIKVMGGQQVREWAKMISGLVAVPIDRNPGGTLVVCPVLYLHACRMTFNWNASFVPVLETEEQIICEMKERYRREGLGNIAAWGKISRIGRAYILPKDKDIERWRPISPTSSDPARLASARLGRATRYMMFAVGDELHFDLRSTDVLKCKCLEIQNSLEEKCVSVWARSYDVKDMFVKLSHGSIMKAISWVIDHHRRKNLVGVRVSRRGKLCMMAQNPRGSEGFILMKFEQIKKAVKFELNNAFTICASEILKQVFGIPMGRNSSPALACLVCARSEAAFLDSLGADRRLVKGMRMIDDAAIIEGLEDEEEESTRKADRILSRFEECYDESLNLVRKDNESNSMEFLGTRIFVDIAPIAIHVFPRTRNQMSLAETGQLKVHSMQDFHSFSKKLTKRATLLASMLRAYKMSTSDEATVATISTVVMVANLRGYPSKVSLGALARFAKLSGSHWGATLSMLYPGMERVWVL
ncbi:hypothetical protein CBR_g639 [Chara braunii]|uniref:Reverse transcriptase domain-containing protein n=1 Tax=Chara braunii TaxID=69332 RepID=A0A388KBR8_CHABU|nr:hypothetical protein CBR_g639 [Chara braunii]|eukprot:GBG67505.1 hypothetical protein CBR_g639 [Chara braunii]